MTSIHTNAAAMAALTASRLLDTQNAAIQRSVSTGLRISDASHDAAYWSIATTMRSDTKVLSTVRDAIGLGAAIVDTAYTALNDTVSVLGELRSRLAAAASDGVDRHALQEEIAQLAAQTRTIASSASVGGVNWLSTDIDDIFDAPLEERQTSILASYQRSASGHVSLGQIMVDLRSSALFNESGGGILEADPRSPKSIGGVRWPNFDGSGYSTSNSRAGGAGRFDFMFSGPMDFTTGGSISFDLTVDADDPSDAFPGPYHAGVTTPITIDLATVNGALPSSGGVIDTFTQYITVLNHALGSGGAFASSVTQNGQIIQNQIAILSAQNRGLDGSYVGISNLVSTLDTGGLAADASFGPRGNAMDLTFSPFKIFDGVAIDFDFRVNGVVDSYVLDRAFVDATLGTVDGNISSVDDMVVILQALVGRPGLDIQANGGSIRIETDTNDRWSGSKSRVGFTGISVNVEPIPTYGVQDIDIVANPALLDDYLDAVDTMLQRTIEGASFLGTVKKRIELQDAFLSTLRDSVDRGIGHLVDAHMDEMATRLSIVEVQRQLVQTSLGMAISRSQTILQLFQ